MLTLRQIKAFSSQGYCVVKDPKIADLKSKIREDLKKVALLIAAKMPDYTTLAKELSNESFEKILNQLNQHEQGQVAKITPVLYEAFPKYHSVLGLLDNKFIIRLCKALGLSHPSPSTVPVSRIDRPGNAFYDTPWHQDGWYTMFCPNAVTFWLPVTKLRRDMGLIQVVPKSHVQGLLPFKKFDEGYEPYVAANAQQLNSKTKEVMVRDDEVLVFNQYLLHKSGINTSNKCRVSLQLRYNDLSTMTDVFSTFTPVHAVKVKNRQEELLRVWSLS